MKRSSKQLLLVVGLVVVFVSLSPFIVAVPMVQEDKMESGLSEVWFGVPFRFMKQEVTLTPPDEAYPVYVRANPRYVVNEYINSNYIASIFVLLLPALSLYILLQKDKNSI